MWFTEVLDGTSQHLRADMLIRCGAYMYKECAQSSFNLLVNKSAESCENARHNISRAEGDIANLLI